MIRKILEKSGAVEVVLRRLSTKLPSIKKIVRHVIKSSSKTEVAVQEDGALIQEVREALCNCGVQEGDIVIIHSSTDGLRCLGLSTEKIIDLIIDVFTGCTLVFPTFPIEPRKMRTIYNYDPRKSLCWTGILPNILLKRTGVVRSRFPYNSLAAIGKDAEAMMKDDLKSIRPHDRYSSWEYCRQHHAKILFLGTTSRESNTMAIHMVPDIMDQEWPIDNWYIQRLYEIQLDGVKLQKTVEVQDGFWYQYVNEYKTDFCLKSEGLLRNIGIADIPIELIYDSLTMTEFLVNRCKNGDLMYRIPKKYYR